MICRVTFKSDDEIKKLDGVEYSSLGTGLVIFADPENENRKLSIPEQILRKESCDITFDGEWAILDGLVFDKNIVKSLNQAGFFKKMKAIGTCGCGSQIASTTPDYHADYCALYLDI